MFDLFSKTFNLLVVYEVLHSTRLHFIHTQNSLLFNLSAVDVCGNESKIGFTI